MFRNLRLLLVLSYAAAVSLTAAAQEATPTFEAHITAARTAQAHANCHLAAQEYRAAVKAMPDNAELRTNLAIALFCDAQPDDAVVQLHTALHLKPSLTTPHLFLGLASFQLGRLDPARQELTSYLRQTPADLTGHLWLGYTLAALNRSAEAEVEFKEVLGQDPSNLDATYALSQAAMDVSHQKARELQAIDPDGVQLLLLAGEHYRAIGDEVHATSAESEAAKRLQASKPTEEGNAAATDLARQAQAAETEALTAFQTILQTAPDSSRAHQVLADSALASGQDDVAIAEYETAIRLKPKTPGVHETLAHCLVTRGRFPEALAALNAERALTPVASARLLTSIGQAEHAIGNNDAARHTLQSAVRDAAAPPEASLLLAQVELAQGHAAVALPLLRHFLELRPNSSAAYYALSRAYRTLGDHAASTQALVDYQRTSEDARARALIAPLTRDSAASPVAADLAGNPEKAHSTLNP